MTAATAIAPFLFLWTPDWILSRPSPIKLLIDVDCSWPLLLAVTQNYLTRREGQPQLLCCCYCCCYSLLILYLDKTIYYPPQKRPSQIPELCSFTLDGPKKGRKDGSEKMKKQEQEPLYFEANSKPTLAVAFEPPPLHWMTMTRTRGWKWNSLLLRLSLTAASAVGIINDLFSPSIRQRRKKKRTKLCIPTAPCSSTDDNHDGSN